VSALVDAGLPSWRAESLRELYESYGKGEATAVSDDVARVTGAPPRPLEQFARDYTDELLGVDPAPAGRGVG
jgi:hypothetical protein